MSKNDGSGEDLQLVVAGATAGATQNAVDLPKASAAGGVGALVEYKKSGVVLREDEEDLEVKLRRIIDNVPVRVNNTSGSSAGSGSGDFHQYRQMRRKEQDRVTRMDADYQRRKELAEFNMRREERLKAAEERTAKKRLRDWKTASKLVEHMAPSFSLVSVGLLNQLLRFLGKSGKIQTMMKLFYKIVASGEKVSPTTYPVILKNLLAAGKWRKYIEVLQWMEDAGIQPPIHMYRNVLSYAWRDGGMEHALHIQERINTLKEKAGCTDTPQEKIAG